MKVEVAAVAVVVGAAMVEAPGCPQPLQVGPLVVEGLPAREAAPPQCPGEGVRAPPLFTTSMMMLFHTSPGCPRGLLLSSASSNTFPRRVTTGEYYHTGIAWHQSSDCSFSVLEDLYPESSQYNCCCNVAPGSQTVFLKGSFRIGLGVRQGCVMFSVYMDSEIMEMRYRTQGEGAERVTNDKV